MKQREILIDLIELFILSFIPIVTPAICISMIAVSSCSIPRLHIVVEVVGGGSGAIICLPVLLPVKIFFPRKMNIAVAVPVRRAVRQSSAV
jgi:hypothetical protein